MQSSKWRICEHNFDVVSPPPGEAGRRWQNVRFFLSHQYVMEHTRFMETPNITDCVDYLLHVRKIVLLNIPPNDVKKLVFQRHA